MPLLPGQQGIAPVKRRKQGRFTEGPQYLFYVKFRKTASFIRNFFNIFWK